MKKLILLALCALIFVSAALPAFAFDATLPRIVDTADLLSDAEEAALMPRIKAFLSLGFDCVILTENTAVADITTYTDDYYDSHGYGADGLYYGSAEGKGRSGFLFYVNMTERQLYINTAEEGINVLSDYARERIFDDVAPYFTKGDYYTGFVTYLDELYNGYLVGYSNPDPYAPYKDPYYDPYYAPTDYYDPNWGVSDRASSRLTVGAVAVCLLVGFGISAVIFGTMRHNMKNARIARNADYAVKRETFRLTTRVDRFLYSHTTRTPINTDNNNNHGGHGGASFGGTSHHTSSGGISHGGGGRGF